MLTQKRSCTAGAGGSWPDTPPDPDQDDDPNVPENDDDPTEPDGVKLDIEMVPDGVKLEAVPLADPDTDTVPDGVKLDTDTVPVGVKLDTDTVPDGVNDPNDERLFPVLEVVPLRLVMVVPPDLDPAPISVWYLWLWLPDEGVTDRPENVADGVTARPVKLADGVTGFPVNVPDRPESETLTVGAIDDPENVADGLTELPTNDPPLTVPDIDPPPAEPLTLMFCAVPPLRTGPSESP